MKLLISAAEASSDRHGAQLVVALRRLWSVDPALKDKQLEIFGIGGPDLKAADVDIVVPASDLLAMGSTEVLFRLPRIFRALRKMTEAARIRQPELAIVIDYPDFHFRLAQGLKRLGIPAIDFIPPKIWVWRTGRVKTIRRLFRKVLCILPFEPEIYREQGVDAVYVGNPLVDELPLNLTREQAREALGIPASARVLVAMPGSRPSEIRRHMDLVFESSIQLAEKMGQRLLVLIPLPRALLESEPELMTRFHSTGDSGVEFRFLEEKAPVCLRAADAGLIKSGTSTLEAALLECPLVVFYRASPFTSWLFKKVIRKRFQGPVGLVNLFTGWRPGNRLRAKEFLLDEAQAGPISQELHSLFSNQSRREEVLQDFRLLKKLVGVGGESPSERAAKEVLEFLKAHLEISLAKGSLESPRFQLWAVLGSLIWCGINSARRRVFQRGWIHSVKLPCKVISVGNVQAGGAGKTPLVSWIASEALARGREVVILSRGYGGNWEKHGGIIAPASGVVDPNEVGDEPALLHEQVPGAWIGIGADRVRAFERVREAMKVQGKAPELVILDDGLQHLKLHRDLDVVALTGERWWSRLHREFDCPSSALRVWTKGGFAPRDYSIKIRFENTSSLQAGSRPLWLVTGVADANEVVRTVRLAGHEVKRHVRFPDHARYHRDMVHELIRQASAEQCRVAVTGKDWVKWRSLGVPRGQVEVLEPQIRFEQGQALWDQLLSIHFSPSISHKGGG